MTPETDVWDGVTVDPGVCEVCGSDACEGHDVSHDEPERPKRRWQSAADVIDTAGATPIIEGIGWADSITVLAGESTAGKTFVLLDLFAHVSAGIRWHGREVTEGSVIYIPYEGHAGLRLRALRDVAGHRLDNLYVVQGFDPISPICDRDRVELPSRGELDLAGEIDDIVAHIRAHDRPPVVAVAIDTVRASLNGNENDSGDISAYLRASRRLLSRVPGATGILSHHSGWQDGESKRKRERGSSAFRGNVDATLYLEADEYNRDTGTARLTLTTLKVREGENPPPLHLIRRRVEIPGLVDRWGRPATSCVIERDYRTRDDREAEQARAVQVEKHKVDIAVLRAMRDFPTATSIRILRAHVGLGEPAVTAAVGRILAAGWATPGKRGEPFQVLPSGLQALNGTGADYAV